MEILRRLFNKFKLRHYQDIYDRFSQPDEKYIDLFVGYYTAERNREQRSRVLEKCRIEIESLTKQL